MKTKFLIIRFSSIGDIVLTSPVVRCLKQQFEGEVEVHFLTKRKFSSLVECNPNIDKVHCLEENNWEEVITSLKAVQLDYIIDLHRNIRSYRVKRALGLVDFTFHKLNFKKWLYTTTKLDYLPQKHVVDRYMETLAGFDVKNDEKGLDFYFSSNFSFKNEQAKPFIDQKYLAWVIGGTYNTKKMPVNKILSIISKINIKIWLIGGVAEKQMAEKISALYPQQVVQYCGDLSLEESAFVVKNAVAVVAGDTGLMHIASAFNKPILTLWGNTSPRFGMQAYKPEPHSMNMLVPNLKCHPCSKLGHNTCPKAHFACMQQQNENDIINWIKSF